MSSIVTHRKENKRHEKNDAFNFVRTKNSFLQFFVIIIMIYYDFKFFVYSISRRRLCVKISFVVIVTIEEIPLLTFTYCAISSRFFAILYRTV